MGLALRGGGIVGCVLGGMQRDMVVNRLIQDDERLFSCLALIRAEEGGCVLAPPFAPRSYSTPHNSDSPCIITGAGWESRGGGGGGAGGRRGGEGRERGESMSHRAPNSGWLCSHFFSFLFSFPTPPFPPIPLPPGTPPVHPPPTTTAPDSLSPLRKTAPHL